MANEPSSKRIPVAGPWITQREIDAVTEAAASAWYENASTYNRRFQDAFAEHAGRQYALALPSCTSALHLALASLGVGPGDEVIVPDVTWIATSAPVTYVGATPVFADIDEVSWCLCAESLRACITPLTKAVIVVNLYGHMPAMDEILSICQDAGVAVIEDAAQAIGSTWHGRPAGSFGDVSTFSFHGSKTLTTGEGGMLLTDREDLHEQCMILSDHGRLPGDTNFFNDRVGFKYRMSAVQAAMGLAQLERIDELIEKKRTIYRWYRDRLADVDGLTLSDCPAEAEGTRYAYWMTTVVWNKAFGLDKNEVMSRLWEAGIDTRPFFHPLSSLPAYEGEVEAQRAAARNARAYHISPRGVNLPSHLMLTEDDVQYVCDALLDVMNEARHPSATVFGR